MNAEVEPSVRVISAYKGQSAYVNVAADVAESELSKLWEEYVLDPYWPDWAGNREYFGLAKPAKDLKMLAKHVEDLNKSDIEQQIMEVFRVIWQALPGPDTIICVYVADPDDPTMRDQGGGISGAAPGAGKIILKIRPEGYWKAQLGHYIAHEYHHGVESLRRFESSWSNDLTRWLISEGRAISFAYMIYPLDSTPPWLQALTPVEEAKLWPRMKADLGSRDSGKNRSYMLGGEGIPAAAGYMIGFHIVQSYLRAHPSTSVEDWTALDPKILLEASGYDGSFNG